MQADIKKRLIQAFFYVAGFVSLAGTFPGHVLAASNCHTTEFERYIAVNHIIDGDTLITTGDEHIRLLGIDTPEIDHENNQSQPGAEAARVYLARLVSGERRLGLVYDNEQHDRFGRTLAHLFLSDGTNIQAQILKQGLGLPFIYPPNLGYAACYKQISDSARQSRQGLWEDTAYQPLDVKQLSTHDLHKYRVIRGTVKDINESNHSLTLILSSNFSLDVLKQDLEYFENRDINALGDHLIQAEGIVYRQNKKLRMRIRHPLNLTILSSPD